MAKKEKKQIPKIEREYIIPLRREILKVPRHKRAPKAIKAIKQFIAKHMKIPDRDLSKVKIDIYLNRQIWFRGIRNPITKVKVKVTKKEDDFFVELAELPKQLKFAKKKQDKKKQAGEKAKKQKVEEKPVEDEKKEEKPEEKTKEEKKEEKEKEKSGEEEKKKVTEIKAREQKHIQIQKQKKTQPIRKSLQK